MDDLTNIIFGVIGVIILWGLTERWRIEWQARRKRERQNRIRPDA